MKKLVAQHDYNIRKAKRHAALHRPFEGLFCVSNFHFSSSHKTEGNENDKAHYETVLLLMILLGL